MLGVGSVLVATASLSAGALIAFLLYLNLFFAPIQQLSQVFDSYQQARVAIDASASCWPRRPRRPTAADPVPLPGRSRGDVAFDDVRFSYPTAIDEALRGVDLEIAPGETVALVGETGAGKSTVIKLVARFYDPTAGRVLVDGVPLDDYDLGAFHQQLGVVPQEAFLFSGTIRDNIAYGRPDATDAEVEAAARAVGAHDFIAGCPAATCMGERAGPVAVVRPAPAHRAGPRPPRRPGDPAARRGHLEPRPRDRGQGAPAMGVVAQGRTDPSSRTGCRPRAPPTGSS